MYRRSYLAAASGVGVLSVAGCLGSDEIESLEADLEDLEGVEADLEELEGREAELEGEIEALEASEAELEGEVDDLEAARTELVEARLWVLYESAAMYHELARDEYQTAVEYGDQENWTPAARFFGLAFRSYDAVQEQTYQAGILAREEGYAEAEGIAADSNLYAESMKLAADSYGLAAQYYARGDRGAGDGEVANGDAHFDDAQTGEFHPKDAFESAI